jgi:hypothetical protein
MKVLHAVRELAARIAQQLQTDRFRAERVEPMPT